MQIQLLKKIRSLVFKLVRVYTFESFIAVEATAHPQVNIINN